MNARSRSSTGIALLVAAGCVLALALPSPALAGRPLRTAVETSEIFDGPGGDLAFARSRDAGTTAVRLDARWSDIAPAGSARPAGFDASNPADGAYRWQVLDEQVRRAVAHGLDPIVSFHSAPSWAQGRGSGPGGTVRPDPAELGRFARAAAVRYSGHFAGLPRVHYWQAWNEPNLILFLNPQREGRRILSPTLYRRMLNAFAAGVHGVSRGNRVIAGALTPFSDPGEVRAIAPLHFMRKLLCISTRGRSTCRTRVHFDIWSHHPYTSGGPRHHANGADDVSLGDLPQMRRLLATAVRAHHVVSAGSIPFWVTEFSWDSNPPDPHGVPADLLVRWVAEGLYRMWHAGVSLVTWFQLRDNGSDGQPDSEVFQSGLYYRCSGGLSCDRPKPALAAFRFPFAAFRAKGGVRIWGRTPGGVPASVVIQRAIDTGWQNVATLRTDRYGIVDRRLRSRAKGSFRAVLPASGDASPAFAIGPTPDLNVNPFG